jgi:hypothetical protein
LVMVPAHLPAWNAGHFRHFEATDLVERMLMVVLDVCEIWIEMMILTQSWRVLGSYNPNLSSDWLV